MSNKTWRCKICGKQTDGAVCWDCHKEYSQPCVICGKPTPVITRAGKIAKNPTCVACTSSLNADKRRIGIKCKICGNRYPCTSESDYNYKVCPICQAIEIPCPVCDNPMPKYRKAGKLRVFCSSRCNKLSHPTTSKQAKKAMYTRFANHVYKSRQNDIARGKAEYKEWRQAVFKRDNFTCQDCGAHYIKGSGKAVVLHPHHIKSFATHHDLRYDVSNGITLCVKCHRKRHKHVFIGRIRKRDHRQLSLPNVEL